MTMEDHPAAEAELGVKVGGASVRALTDGEGLAKTPLWRIRWRLFRRSLATTWGLFRENKMGMFGLALIGLFALMAIIHPILMATVWEPAVYDPVNGYDAVATDYTVVETVTDPTSGFMAFGPRAIRLLARHHPTGYGEPALALVLARNRLRVREVPVPMRRRVAGRTSLTLPRAGLALARALLQLLGRPRGGCDLLGHQRAVLRRVRRRMADAARSRPQHRRCHTTAMADGRPARAQPGHRLCAGLCAGPSGGQNPEGCPAGGAAGLGWVPGSGRRGVGAARELPTRVVPDPCR